MSTASTWLLAARPKTLSAGICPVLMGSILSWSFPSFSWITFCATLLTALGIQITTNFVNDYADFMKGADTSERKGPLRATQSGLVTVQTMRKAAIITSMATACVGFYLVMQGGAVIALFLCLALILAAAYTTGPYPLAYLGLGDLFVWVFFGPIATCSTYYLQTKQLSWEPLLIGISIGSLSTALLCINNIRDVQEDAKAGKKTLAVRLGVFFVQVEYLICCLIAFLCPLAWIAHRPFVLLSWISFFPLLSCRKIRFFSATGVQYNTALAKTALALLLYTLFFSLGWIMA